MKVGEMLARSKKRLSSYGIKYQQHFADYYDLFLSEEDIKHVHISSILVLTDQRPRSLIAIAYALRLAKALNVNLLAITKGVHQDLIRGEAKDNNINLTFVKTVSEQPSVDYILGIIRDHNVGLVVIHNLYALKEDLLENSPIPVLLAKAHQFFRSSPPKRESKGTS